MSEPAPEIKIGDVVLVRALVVQGPHPQGGHWLHPCDEQRRPQLAKGHAAGHVLTMPMLVKPECIVSNSRRVHV